MYPQPLHCALPVVSCGYGDEERGIGRGAGPSRALHRAHQEACQRGRWPAHEREIFVRLDTREPVAAYLHEFFGRPEPVDLLLLLPLLELLGRKELFVLLQEDSGADSEEGIPKFGGRKNAYELF